MNRNYDQEKRIVPYEEASNVGETFARKGKDQWAYCVRVRFEENF